MSGSTFQSVVRCSNHRNKTEHTHASVLKLAHLAPAADAVVRLIISMWPFQPSQRVRTSLDREDVIEAAKNWYHSPKSFARFLTRFNESDAERVIIAYRSQQAGSIHDPLSDSDEHADTFQEIDAIIQAKFPVPRRGQCHRIWRMKKCLLKERGISWLCPSDLNPYNRYD